MKYVLIALLVALNPIGTSAQKHHLFADAGLSFGPLAPGFSVTYNYKFIKYFGVGIGVQGYDFYPTSIRFHKFIPAVFVDLRLYIRPAKKNQFFSFFDLGMDFYKADGKFYSNTNNIVYTAPRDNGFYTGFGFGYLRRMTKRGSGPYTSLKVILNWTTIKGYDHSKNREIALLSADGALAFSLGFRF